MDQPILNAYLFDAYLESRITEGEKPFESTFWRNAYGTFKSLWLGKEGRGPGSRLRDSLRSFGQA